jgi:hypothetical protein
MTTRTRNRIPMRITGVGPDPATWVVASVLVGGGVGPAVGPAVGWAIGVGLGVAVGDGGGVAVGDALGLGAAVGDGVGVAVEHVDLMIVSLIKVTLPFRASARPSIVTPLFIVMEVRARMVPAKLEPDPSVAELVTCQKTLQGWPPLTKRMELDDDVMRSDVAWKTQTGFASFWPSSVSVPVRSSVTPPAL